MATNPLGGSTCTKGNVFFSLTFDAMVVVVANTFDPNRSYFPMMRGTEANIDGRHRILLPASYRYWGIREGT